MLDISVALEALGRPEDPWHSWRIDRLKGRKGPVPSIPYQDDLGGCIGPSGSPSPGATGEFLCHMRLLDLAEEAPAVIAADWLEEMRTPAMAWLDRPDDVPGELDTIGGSRVWATASAACGLAAVGRDPGGRAFDLLRGEADAAGRFTGGAYPTFAAAGAYWLQSGPMNEMSEWALRWCREDDEEWWAGWEWATALTFWLAAGIPSEHPTVETAVDRLMDDASERGWPDDGALTLRALELLKAAGTWS